MAIKYDLICKTGTYKDKNGDEKNRWSKVGVVMETKQGGLACKIETIPVGFDGWLSLAEPKPKDNFIPKGNDELLKASVSDIDDVPF
jgi:hypothetical protein